MKKVFLVAALSLGTMAAFAQDDVQESNDVNTEVATEAIPESDEATEAVTEESMEASEDVAVAQDGFNEVALADLPEAITTALAADYPGATISKAFVNEASQYKLEVAKEDGSSVELYADADGNWIEM